MRISSITKNAGKACNNRLYRHIRTFEKIVKNYFVIFINLKTFLEKTEYESFLEHAVFLNFLVLLLENKRDYLKYQLEDKMIIDQHFLEF